jgi:chromate transporter
LGTDPYYTGFNGATAVKMSLLLDLFIRFFKIGLVGFGGGWAILPIIEREIVEDAGYLSEAEFYDLVAVAGSTPGPVAVNAATYVGFKLAGLPGATAATLGVILPPFTIISLISYGLTQYFSNHIVQALLKGLKAAVIGLIVIALYSTFKTTVLSLPNIIQITVAIMVAGLVIIIVEWLRIHPIIAILIAGGIGAALGLLHVW